MLSPFAQWLMSMKPASVGGKPAAHEFLTGPQSRSITIEKSEGSQKDKKKKKKMKKKEAKAEERRSSPAKEQGIVSETLAELLSGQGHKEEAIEMYHNLMIRYPEKAGYYLQKINDLRR
jgi:hypothetical protein